jgi:hypothetical protein
MSSFLFYQNEPIDYRHHPAVLLFSRESIHYKGKGNSARCSIMESNFGLFGSRAKHQNIQI